MAAKKTEPEVRMTLGEHLDELRVRLIRSLIAVGVGMAICLLFGSHMFSAIFWPLAVATGGKPPNLYFQSLPEAFNTYLKVCLIAGVILSSPYWTWQFWQFISAGLYEQERRIVRAYFLPGLLLFALGVVFFMVIVAPLVARFFIVFPTDRFHAPTLGPFGQFLAKHVVREPAQVATRPADAAYVQPLLKLGEYISYTALLCLVFGLGFEMPIGVLVLGRTGLVEVAAMRRLRKYVFFVIMVISAVVTPADIGSMIALALPMYLLYELGLVLVGRKKKDRAAA